MHNKFLMGVGVAAEIKLKLDCYSHSNKKQVVIWGPPNAPFAALRQLLADFVVSDTPSIELHEQPFIQALNATELTLKKYNPPKRRPFGLHLLSKQPTPGLYLVQGTQTEFEWFKSMSIGMMMSPFWTD